MTKRKQSEVKLRKTYGLAYWGAIKTYSRELAVALCIKQFKT